MAITGLLFQLPLYLTNTWYTGHLAFNSNKIWTREGKRYDAKKVTDERANFSLERFLQYSVLRKSLTFSDNSRFTEQPDTPSNLPSSLQATLALWYTPSFTTTPRYGRDSRTPFFLAEAVGT
jgi:hypothetical protein